jgi:hypothetical protein
MLPSASTDTTNRTFGTLRKMPLRKKPLRKNVVLLVCLLGLITYSLVSTSMLASVPESQLLFADISVVNNVSDQIQTQSLSPNKDNDNKPLLARTEAHVLTTPKTTGSIAATSNDQSSDENREKPESPYDASDEIIVPNRTASFLIPKVPDSSAAERVNASIVAARNGTNTNNKEVLSPFDSCAPTAQVRIFPQQQSPFWTLQALDVTGTRKTVGGDEFYITYRRDESSSIDPSAVALIHDNKDGTYTLDFFTTPMDPHLPKPLQHSNANSTGKITIYHQYTCGIGFIAPPHKNAWEGGGALFAEYTRRNVPEPLIREYVPPAVVVNLSKFSAVYFVGDSLMREIVFADTIENSRTDRSFYYQKTTFYQENVRSELRTGMLNGFTSKIQKWHGKELLHASDNTTDSSEQQKGVALVLGSAVWDIIKSRVDRGSFFADHLLACRQLVDQMRARYPNVTIVWKSPTALHIHRVNTNCVKKEPCGSITRYASSSRAEFLYRLQKELMEELEVPFLDLYETTYLSASRSLHYDARHYIPSIGRKLQGYFFRDP